MLHYVLAADSPLGPHDKVLVNLLFIAAVLGIGLLVIVGLIAAWRNHLKRQREIEAEHEAQHNQHAPHPDAWATAAQRLGNDNGGLDEAHVSMMDEDDGRADDESNPFDAPGDEDDDDDFPFRDDDDDDGPFDRA